MENLERELSSDTAELTSDKDPKTVVKAAVFLIQKGIKDQVFSVSLLGSWKFNLASFEFYLASLMQCFSKQIV